MLQATKPLRRKARDQAFEAGLNALALARQQLPQVLQHRSMRRQVITPWLWAQVVVLPLVFFMGVWISKPYLFSFWQKSMLLWARLLGLPLGAETTPDVANALGLRWSSVNQLLDMPSDAMLSSVAVVTLLMYLTSYRMVQSAVPLKYLTRIVCCILGVTLLYFWLLPTSFPYTVNSHIQDIANTGYVTMLAIPVMLAMGYYVLNVTLVRKVFFTVLMLGYFAVFVPHQVLVHMVVLQNFSALFMPLLYIAFGALFNILVFVALYAWMASLAPAHTTD